MIKAIFLDMDDTLIVNEMLYDTARATLSGYLSHFGVTQVECDTAIDRIDADMYKKLGYSKERYPATYEAVLLHFIPNASEDMVKQARSFAEKVFNTVAPLKPSIIDAVELLAQLYPVYIVTAGDARVQQDRLTHLPFKDKIEKAFIVDKKTPEVFKDIAQKLNIAPEHIVMVGDSMKSDVIPAVDAGMIGVLIEAKTSSSYHPMHDAPSDFPAERAYRFSSLLEMARNLLRDGSLDISYNHTSKKPAGKSQPDYKP